MKLLQTISLKSHLLSSFATIAPIGMSFYSYYFSQYNPISLMHSSFSCQHFLGVPSKFGNYSKACILKSMTSFFHFVS